MLAFTFILEYFRGCDHCNEWYHGDCIGLTAEESNFIRSFYCSICRGNKSLDYMYTTNQLAFDNENLCLFINREAREIM